MGAGDRRSVYGNVCGRLDYGTGRDRKCVSGVLQKAWNYKGNKLDRYLSGNWEDAWKPVPFLYAVGERMKNDKRKIKEDEQVKTI